MPKYGMPGVAAGPRSARRVGVVVVAVLAVVTLVVYGYRSITGDDGLRVALRTEQIGDGVVAGTLVRVDGVQVGEVTDIAPAGRGTQQISLSLDANRLHGIDDSMVVDYAPANLFGISEIELRPGAGGAPLRSGAVVDLTGRRAADVYDATMGALLRSMSQTSGTVFTADMARVISQAAADVKAFTPLAEALITAGRVIAEHQSMPANELVGQLGPAFQGGGQFAGATIEVLDQIVDIEVLRTNRSDFDAGVKALTSDILPALTGTVNSASQLSGYTDMLAPTLNLLALAVPDPQQSAADLRALLTRLGVAFKEGPDGPVLDLEVDVDGVAGGQR
ncbi:MlaD family protein [Nocardia carnea]|uniref:MlaD family protein n=1 Tax=Nocardia carnea TaxID=37328 RepID=UPI002456B063|nr:MlaD family protein [Nocardia carnea]